MEVAVKKRYTIEARGLVLGHASTEETAVAKARRLSAQMGVSLDVYVHTSTRTEWVLEVGR